MAKKLKKGESWYGGLSDCCDAPIKGMGQIITILVCSECEEMCNPKREVDDYMDFYDEDDDRYDPNDSRNL